jgi:pyridoxamine 5'-phosphate oxidase
MQYDISRIRRDYSLKDLSEDSVHNDPLVQFTRWLDEALDAQVNEPTAMTLATAGTNGQPSARLVLLKDVTEKGLTFFTNFESKKGRQLHENPRAAIVFFWPELERQVRFEGITEKLPSWESDEYFYSRPAGSKAGARASRQSSKIASRELLENEMLKITSRFKNKNIPRPPYWGGYRLIPGVVEFWQGRPDRLHDRIEYEIRDDKWTISRLSP